jgi:hypothetical protein
MTSYNKEIDDFPVEFEFPRIPRGADNFRDWFDFMDDDGVVATLYREKSAGEISYSLSIAGAIPEPVKNPRSAKRILEDGVMTGDIMFDCCEYRCERTLGAAT